MGEKSQYMTFKSIVHKLISMHKNSNIVAFTPKFNSTLGTRLTWTVDQ